MKSPSNALGETFDSICANFAEQIGELASGDVNIDRAVATNALREATWYLVEKFTDQKSNLSEMLEILADLAQHEIEAAE